MKRKKIKVECPDCRGSKVCQYCDGKGFKLEPDYSSPIQPEKGTQ